MEQEELQAIIEDGRDRALNESRGTYPRHVHRISDVGHPCHRYLYHCIADWDKAVGPDLSLLGIFKLGHRIEQQVIDFFNSEVGPKCNPKLRIIRQGTPTSDRLLGEHKIFGTDDGALAYESDEGQYIPFGTVDLKSCSQGMFNLYSDIESLKRHRWSFLYLGQIQLYAFANNYECGYLFFASKQNIFYNWKLIKVPVDFSYVEGILQKCRSVNEHIAKGEPAERINQPFWCTGCRFESLCLPELVPNGEGPKLNESEEIDNLIGRVQELRTQAKEYAKLYESLKGFLIKGQPLITKHCMIDWKEVVVNRRACEATSYTQWRMKMIPFRDDEDVDDSDD